MAKGGGPCLPQAAPYEQPHEGWLDKQQGGLFATCVVCLDKDVEYVIGPCGHAALCGDCATDPSKMFMCARTLERLLCDISPRCAALRTAIAASDVGEPTLALRTIAEMRGVALFPFDEIVASGLPGAKASVGATPSGGGSKPSASKPTRPVAEDVFTFCYTSGTTGPPPNYA